ncbi:AAA family ATPase [Pseudomonas protegens]|uniref:AAA family ATPase n=1 Tax=Pseudomonas protegens TaxID=380021 RepID=UPI001B342B6F|nr:AAA family ATPase [Pseudomonas protegens]MBP5101395.1 AAA family ATPase [Pseudomonas protegens]MBP5133346.1 AAA family ATPase [Pseudomonas protegens]MBP5147924.1 AAA family ATPase [Pseudomonas protegens]
MRFIVGQPVQYSGELIVYLTPNTRWNDYSFVTGFHAYVSRDDGIKDVGEVKIGFFGQSTEDDTYRVVDKDFRLLSDEFFSLGQNPDYYSNLLRVFGHETVGDYLSALKDVVYNENIFERSYRERVFVESLSRFVSVSTIKGQFREILSTGVSLEKYGFLYCHESGESLDFQVVPDSKPPTNVHALIGRNGVGKSYILQTIASSIDKRNGEVVKINGDNVTAFDFGQLLYFSLGVFGSPLDCVDFNDSKIRIDRTKKKYIGIYNQETKKLKDIAVEMSDEFSISIYNCLLGSEVKRDRWLKAVGVLEADVNFKNLNLSTLALHESERELKKEASLAFSSLSSGHAAVLYYVTSVVELVEDKTICLFDEPENHLHPPLLAAFIRVLSEVLSTNNGIAIVATHSPVVLQEIPRSCVWCVNGGGDFARPSIETFGEGVGEITSDVFNLDMRNSGFYSLVGTDAKALKSYKGVMNLYKGQVGSEGRAVVIASIPRGDG